MSSLIGSLFGGGEGGFGDFNPFDHSSAERHYQDVYYAPPERHHEAKFSHEAISAAAGFAAMHAYEAHLRATGQEVSHPVMKEILAAIAAAEVDKLAETKGLDWLDRHKAKKMAEKQAHALAEQRYGRGGNGWEYARSQGGPSYEYNFGGGNPYYASGYGGGNVGGYAGGNGGGYGGSQYGGGYGGGDGGYGAPPQAAYGGEYGAPPGPPPGAYGGYGGPPQGEYGGYGAQGGYGGYGGPPQGAYGAPPPQQGAYGYGEPPFEERREHHHHHHHHREEY